MKYLGIILILLLTSLLCLAQSSPSPSPAFAAPTSAVSDWIIAHLSTIVTYGGLALSEVVMRIFPTAKPASWLLAVSAVLKWLSQLSTTISGALDGILQNTTA
jgi:hypothetical protein